MKQAIGTRGLRSLVSCRLGLPVPAWFGHNRIMSDGTAVARVGALFGEPARAKMLVALLGGEALTATELARGAGVAKPTASAHLAKLLGARLVAVESQGRHRYFRLADRSIARLVESLLGAAGRSAP